MSHGLAGYALPRCRDTACLFPADRLSRHPKPDARPFARVFVEYGIRREIAAQGPSSRPPPWPPRPPTRRRPCTRAPASSAPRSQGERPLDDTAGLEIDVSGGRPSR